MKINQFTSLFLVLSLIGTVVPAFAADKGDDESLVRLDTHLDRIRQEYRLGRELGGGTLVGLGVLFGAGGTVLAQTQLTGAANTDARNTVTGVSLGVGALYAGLGALVLVLKGDFETLPEKYLGMAGGSDEEKHRKVITGEVSLQSLSDKARFSRLLSAGTLGVFGGALLVSQTSSSSSTQSSSLYTGLTYLGLAVLEFVLESSPERENNAFRTWKASN